MEPNKLGYNKTVIENVRSTTAIWEAILSDIMLQTEKFILSLTITPKQIENKTLVPSAHQQKKKTVFKLTELILDEGWSGHKSDDTYRDFNKST